MNPTSNYRSNSVVSGVAEYEAQSSSPPVFVPSTADTDFGRTMNKLIGQDKKKVIFPCEDIREKNKRKIEDLKDSFLFFCSTSILNGMFPLRMRSKQKTEGQLKTTQENEVRMFVVYNLFK